MLVTPPLVGHQSYEPVYSFFGVPMNGVLYCENLQFHFLWRL